MQQWLKEKKKKKREKEEEEENPRKIWLRIAQELP
jgi:hypothetical protein